MASICILKNLLITFIVHLLNYINSIVREIGGASCLTKKQSYAQDYRTRYSLCSCLVRDKESITKNHCHTHAESLKIIEANWEF